MCFLPTKLQVLFFTFLDENYCFLTKNEDKFIVHMKST